MTASLVLGPLLRYTGEDAATIWVETDDATTVEVTVAGRVYAARTFSSGSQRPAVDTMARPAGRRPIGARPPSLAEEPHDPRTRLRRRHARR